VTALPPTPEGVAATALGGALLAVNRSSDQPRAAYAVIEYLTRPEQMRERARALGHYPPRPSLYASGELEGALPLDPLAVRELIERAVARPVTPAWAELSGILQVQLHRALSRQTEPRAALEQAARAMRERLARMELAPAP
jgi:multiple sugar transport system substrate-binding protein